MCKGNPLIGVRPLLSSFTTTSSSLATSTHCLTDSNQSDLTSNKPPGAMTQPPPTVEFGETSHTEQDTTRSSKRLKYESHSARLGDERGDPLAVPAHPLGVRPSGNAYTTTRNLKANAGLLAALPDDLLLQFLECLDASDLLRLGATCKALHAFSRAEELWKTLLIE